MAHNLQPPTTPTPFADRSLRRAGRTVLRRHVDARVAVAGVESTADLSVAKLDAATEVTGHAMADVLRISQLQRSFELLQPDASARLNLLADDHALNMLELTGEHRRCMRRFR